MVLLGLVRAVALLRRGTGASWRDALGAFFIWQSTALVVARASVLALFARKAAFLRTPKTSERTRWWEALRANWAESILAVFGFAGIAARPVQVRPAERAAAGGPAVVPHPRHGRGPGQQLGAARRAALPAGLRDRRRTEYRRDRRAFAAGVATGGVVAVLGIAIAAVALLYTGHQVQTPNLVGPAQGSSAPATPSHSPSSSPSATPSATTSSSSSPSPSPSPSASASPSATPTPTPSPT